MGAVAPVLTATFRDGTGVPVDVGAVTVSAVDWAGLSVLASSPADNPSPGIYTVTLASSAVVAVTQLAVTWTASGGRVARSTVDVVGSRLVWPDEFAAQPNVNLSERRLEDVSAAIAWFEDLAYGYLNWSPIERFRRVTLRSSSWQLILPDAYITALLGVTWQASGVADVVATAPQLALLEVADSGLLCGSYQTGKARVAYTHGNPDAGETLHDAALTAVRLHLLENTAGRPAISISDGLGGTTRFTFAGAGRPTGIPEVDSVLNGLRIPVCA